VTLTGTPYTAGSGTTNFPLFYMNDGTGPTSFSANGTQFGINTVSGFTGNFLDFHVNGGSSVFSVNYQGNGLFAGTLGVTGHVTVEGVTSTGATGTGKFVFDTSPTISAPTISGHPTVEGVTSTGATGTGKFVFDGSPTLTTASLGSSTATTQTAGDNSTKVATTAYTNTVYNLIQTSGSPYTLLGLTGYYWNNSGAAYTFQLDAPVAGKQYCFGNYSGETHAITVKSTTSVYIVYKGTNGTVTSGTLVSGGAAGDFACMVGVDSTHYMVTGAGYGTWNNN